MIMDDSWYIDWYWNKATDNEKKLIKRVGEFDYLFKDMLFELGTSPYRLIQCQSKSQSADGWINDEAPRPDELVYFCYTYFHFKVESLSGCSGYFNPKEQILCVQREALDDDKVILHEMIHLHEYVINELPMYFHDMLYWALYKDLCKKIPKLDEIIEGHAHILTGSSLYSKGGLHDILFLLKSFDLDIRQRYPLGTVFAYGREIEFEDYKYNSVIEHV